MSGTNKIRPAQFAIEGNIGAGKSTFLKLIGSMLPLEVALIPEPHEQWQQVGKDNLLERFYADAPRWAFTFQSYVIMTRLRLQQQYTGLQLRIAERSLYSDYYCFARNCYEAGLMSPLEWKIYEDWFLEQVIPTADPVHGFIYLRTEPSLCYERIAKRKRHEEAEIPLSYLQAVHEKHENLLIKRHIDIPVDIPVAVRDTPVLVIECNEEFEADGAVQERYARLLLEFLTEYGTLPEGHVIYDTQSKSKQVSSLSK